MHSTSFESQTTQSVNMEYRRQNGVSQMRAHPGGSWSQVCDRNGASQM